MDDENELDYWEEIPEDEDEDEDASFLFDSWLYNPC